MNKTTMSKGKTYETLKYYFSIFILIVLLFLLLGLLSVVTKGQNISLERKHALGQAKVAAQAFLQVMFSDNKDIFLSLLEETQCAIVFPSVTKADYLKTKQGRRGMASCRQEKNWGASVFVVLQTVSVNLKMQRADLVFLFKNASELTAMLEGKTKFGKDIKFEAFNKSGVNKFEEETNVMILGIKNFNEDANTIDQGLIQADKVFMRKTYGRGTTTSEWLKESSRYAPKSLYSFNHSIKKCEKKH